ncbi:2-oxoglutarate synthase subunit KorC [uncultured Desulfobacterium sp.]|uniref:2-oxoglutarate synthase subunit KorC n=1 Tax=uncultured Desulfobacterium sp. TaxID=201089 RepID=A0A445N438_9BACT|nr:2-oxoglutarate synthase subunit KorC [uncultured Desulfobacterium sp.]
MKKAIDDITRTEIIITGFGGQGIVLAGKILGKAAVLGDNKESTLVQAYGPEARGGACSAQVIISEGSIHYPYVRRPHVLVCMSQGGFDKFVSQLRDGGTLIIDQDLVKARGYDHPIFSIPSTRLAEEMGRKMMANIIMLGFLTAVTGVVSIKAALNAVIESVPKGTENTNKTAFNKGCDYGLAVLKGKEKKAIGKTGA